MKRIAILLLAVVMLLASCANYAAAEIQEDKQDKATVSVDDPEIAAATLFAYNKDTLFGIKRDTQATAFSADVVKMNAIDAKNIVKTEGGYTYVNIKDSHFSLSGFPFDSTNAVKLFRLEFAKYKEYSTDLQKLGHNSAGGRIRFKTNATSMKITVTLKNVNTLANMPDTGTHGCDVYVGSGANPKWVANVRSESDSYSKDVSLPAGVKEVMIVLPPLSGVSSMNIAFPTGSAISSPDPYVIEDPVVFYGSSSTQGLGASRPGAAYTEITTIMLGANLVNYGFAGNALGESVVAQSIAKMNMSAFVLDYDQDSTVDNLRATHYNLYKTVRDAKPNVPIIMISRFSQGYSCSEAEAAERRAIIKDTYDKAVAAGDKNVYYIDGSTVFPAEYRDFCLVDGEHLNDVGMYFAANAIYPVLKDALTKAGYIK